MYLENSLSNSFFSWGIVFFSSLAIAIPNDCVRLELSEDVLQDSSYAAYIGEGIQATYLSFRTLNHGLVTVNQDISMYFEVYGRTCSAFGENNGRAISVKCV